MRERREKYSCPNQDCKQYGSRAGHFYRREGQFITRWNHQPVPRYGCKECGKKFSSHTFRRTYQQKKPHLNQAIYQLYCSGMTQRRIAKQLRCNLKTVVRKFLFMAVEAQLAHEAFLKRKAFSMSEIQFDEMESFEHTRLKPLSLALAVSGDGKHILDARIGVLNYKGRLAGLARRRYGVRKDTSREARDSVWKTALGVAAPSGVKIITDAKPQYATEIGRRFKDYKNYHHLAVPNRRNLLQYAQNPLRRKNSNDPLFWLNHVAARLRHDLSRMMRKVWTTTKRKDRLEAHLSLFLAYYNGYVI